MMAARGAMTPPAMARVSTSSAPRGSGYRASRAHSVTSIARGANARVATRVGSRSRRRVVSPPRASGRDPDETSAGAGSDAGESSSVSASSSSKEKKRRKGTGEVLSGLWNELKYVSLRDDPLPEAADLLATIEASKARPKPGERWDDKRWREQEEAAGAVAGKVGAYWSAKKWDALRTATRCARRGAAHVLRGERGHRGRAAFGAAAHRGASGGGRLRRARGVLRAGRRARSSAGTWTSSKT